MRVLFLHPNFPAQFRHLATALSQNPRHQVFFATQNQDAEIKGVKKIVYQPTRKPNPQTHHYIRNLEAAVLEGQMVYRLVEQMKQQRLIPDLIYGHSGWGPTLYVKDLLPQIPLLCYFEWFYNAVGSDADFDPSEPLKADDYPRIRTRNASILLDLVGCDQGLSPTHWQKTQFPKEFQDKIHVHHDGIDTDYFLPKPDTKLVLPNLDLSKCSEIVTYVARGMDPYRGFPQFMEAVALLQQRRPQCQVVVVGADRVCYGRSPEGGGSYKTLMLSRLDLDLNRLHFTGSLPYGDYLKVLQASSVHIYLTRPFVLSWSMLEALSAGCLIVASGTPPVTEVIEDGVNGLLVDFFKPEQICERVIEALENPGEMAKIRQQARETILERYALSKLLPQHLEFMQHVAQKK